MDALHNAGFDHPCKQTCSGWQQGFDRGKEIGVAHIYWEGSAYLIKNGECFLHLLERLEDYDLQSMKELCMQVQNQRLNK